jgi:glutamine phosphoribosylpyrophosphate amidotransferase
MCGVIGISMVKADLDLIRKIFKESMIRGKHATGLTYVSEGVLKTHKDGFDANTFLDKFDLEQVVDSDGGVKMIGHIRYSTSDLRYNQPFSNDKVSIVHNGVISQEDPSTWMYKTETFNDSELILRALEDNQIPLKFFRPASMAVVELHNNGTLVGYRNEARPLWYSATDQGIVFTSTADIAVRSRLTSPMRCSMFNEYRYADNTLSVVSYPMEGVEDLQC